jgi:uncharacterized protein YqgC (DUF456 family)
LTPVLLLAGLAVFFLAHCVALVMIPLGLPGTWLQVIAALLLVVASDGTRMSWTWVLVFGALAAAGELMELLAGQWGARRFGGSHAAGWGALAGGIAGAVLGGVPVPVVGSVIASFVGTFVGAVLGELWARREARPDLRVGLGAVLGRAVGVGGKLAVAFTIAILSATVVMSQLLATRP